VSDDPDFILIGRLRRPHGIRGEICVEVLSDMPERFNSLSYVLVRNGEGTRQFDVERVRWKGELALVKLLGVDGRQEAGGLTGAMLGVREQDAYPTPEDTYYVFELEGARVVNQAGVEIGVVEDVLKMPANDVLVLRTPKGEALIPAVESVVKKVDPDAGLIVIEEMEGLLD
jgi:16S rRNA processing protein RimM